MPYIYLLLVALLSPANAPAEEALPPARIYHVGSRDILKKNEGNISRADWDEFIMGNKTRYETTSFRRGLYGGETLPPLDFYGDGYLGTPKQPWVMEIHIKAECRQLPVVTSIFLDPRFFAWLRARQAQDPASIAGCMGADHRLDEKSISFFRQESDCNSLMNEFLQSQNFRVVRDAQWRDSWYIRDHDCIEKILTTPTDVLRILAEMEWRSMFHTKAGTLGGVSNFLMLVTALKEAGTVDPALLGELRRVTAASDLTPMTYSLKVKREPWVSLTAPALIDAYARCSPADFRALAEGVERHFQQPGSEDDVSAYAYLSTLPGTFALACR